MTTQYRVLVRLDRQADGTPGKYVLNGHKFSAEGAAKFAQTVSKSREPRVVSEQELKRIIEVLTDFDPSVATGGES